MAVRAPPKRVPPPPPKILNNLQGTSAVPDSEVLDSWIAKKARMNLLKKQFAFELEQGILTIPDIELYTGLAIGRIQEEIKDIRLMIEMYNHEYPETFMRDLLSAIRAGKPDFDFFLWVQDNQRDLREFQDKEVVYYRKRTTAFTLEKPCPNCGKKELIAEAAVFTRAADEAVDQFATCKNCSARYRLQAVL